MSTRRIGWVPGRPFVQLSDGKKYVLAPFQKPLHRDGVWLVHWIDLPEPNGWVNLRVYRDEADNDRRMWSVGFTTKGKPARGTALKELETAHPGMTAWLAELAKGNRPPAPVHVSGKAIRLARANEIPMPVRKQILNELRTAFQQKRPLSLIRQTRQTNRYAPEVIAEKFGVPEINAKALLEKWRATNIVRNLCADKTHKLSGLRVSDVANEELL